MRWIIPLSLAISLHVGVLLACQLASSSVPVSSVGVRQVVNARIISVGPATPVASAPAAPKKKPKEKPKPSTDPKIALPQKVAELEASPVSESTEDDSADTNVSGSGDPSAVAGGTGTGGGNGEPGEATASDYRSNPAPQYPMISRRLHEEGRVVLRVRIDESGKVVDLEVHKSSGFDRLDHAGLAAVKAWTFVPRQVNGKSMGQTLLVPVLFKLNS